MRVKDQYRKNPLSLQPGGHEVTVFYQNGFKRVYDKVKHPEAFIKYVRSDNTKNLKITAIYIDDKKVSL
jgi:hypothetical protein